MNKLLSDVDHHTSLSSSSLSHTAAAFGESYPTLHKLLSDADHHTSHTSSSLSHTAAAAASYPMHNLHSDHISHSSTSLSHTATAAASYPMHNLHSDEDHTERQLHSPQHHCGVLSETLQETCKGKNVRDDSVVTMAQMQQANCKYLITITKSPGQYILQEHNNHSEQCGIYASKQLIPQELSHEMDAWICTLLQCNWTVDQVKKALSEPSNSGMFDIVMPPPRPPCSNENKYIKLKRFNPTPKQLDNYKYRIKAGNYLDAADEKDALKVLMNTPGAKYKQSEWSCTCQEIDECNGVKLCKNDKCKPFSLMFILPYQERITKHIIHQRKLARNSESDMSDIVEGDDEFASLHSLLQSPQQINDYSDESPMSSSNSLSSSASYSSSKSASDVLKSRTPRPSLSPSSSTSLSDSVSTSSSSSSSLSDSLSPSSSTSTSSSSTSTSSSGSPSYSTSLTGSDSSSSSSPQQSHPVSNQNSSKTIQGMCCHLDATGQVNMYGYHLYTLMIVNPLTRRGCPIAHSISASKNQNVTKDFLTFVQDNIPELRIETIIIDKDEAELAGIRQFENHVKYKVTVFLCFFHTMQAVQRYIYCFLRYIYS